MLTKVVTLTHSRAGQGFCPVLRYLRVDQRKGTPSRPALEPEHPQLAQEPFGPVLRYLLRADPPQPLSSRSTPETGQLQLAEEPF